MSPFIRLSQPKQRAAALLHEFQQLCSRGDCQPRWNIPGWVQQRFVFRGENGRLVQVYLGRQQGASLVLPVILAYWVFQEYSTITAIGFCSGPAAAGARLAARAGWLARVLSMLRAYAGTLACWLTHHTCTAERIKIESLQEGIAGSGLQAFRSVLASGGAADLYNK
jgi:hypothetical protein